MTHNHIYNNETWNLISEDACVILYMTLNHIFIITRHVICIIMRPETLGVRTLV